VAAEIKPIADTNRTQLNKVIPLSTPFTVYIFPTTFCNFKCVYCAHSLGHQEMAKQYSFKPENMPIETFNRIIEQLKQFDQKVKVVSLTGQGEPLLNKNTASMVKAVKQANVAERIEIISNAALLTPDVAKELIDAGLDRLRVSIQGVTDQTYSEVTGTTTTFKQIVEKLTYFYKNKKNCELFVKVMDIAVEKQEEKDLFYKTFENISNRMFIEQCKPVYDGVEFTKDIKPVSDRYGRMHEHRQVCPLCFFMLGIFPDGDVEPCDTIYKPIVLGNVNNMTLKEMWESKKFRQFRIMQLDKKRKTNPKCAVCCAPDDVAHPEDDLDKNTEEIKKNL